MGSSVCFSNQNKTEFLGSITTNSHNNLPAASDRSHQHEQISISISINVPSDKRLPLTAFENATALTPISSSIPDNAVYEVDSKLN